jgi:hypothetical protein
MFSMVELLLFTLAGIYQGLRQDWNILELAVLGWVWIAVRRESLPRLDFAARFESLGARLARRRTVLCCVAVVGAIAIRLLLVPVLPPPKPVVTDEFSHLLLADTLLHERVANAVHPLWRHFESLHIIQQPHYVSNYFPGNAAVLAAAEWAVGSAWPGVVAMSGVFAGVLAWALMGYLPARWAALGALVAILRFSIGSYWVNAFHGGFLPAIGGAIVAGAFARLWRRASVGLSLLLGVGLSVLAYSRPYEGLAFATPFFLALLARSDRTRRVIPALALGAASLVPLGFYFQRITGSPLVTPYTISQREYGWPMTFAWAHSPNIAQRHPELQAYYNYELEEQRKVDGPLHFLQYLTFRVQEYWRFFLGPALTVPLAWSAWIFRRRRFRVLVAALACAFGAVMLEGAASPHYLAPATVALVALPVLSIRPMRRAAGFGVPLSRIAVVLMAVVLAGRIGAQALGLPYTQRVNYQSWCCKVQGRYDKASMIETLERLPGRHLVIVKTKTDPYNFFQWIYNGADIDGSRIVWARDLGPERNRALLHYFRDRTVWLVDPNPARATIERFPGQ